MRRLATIVLVVSIASATGSSARALEIVPGDVLIGTKSGIAFPCPPCEAFELEAEGILRFDPQLEVFEPAFSGGFMESSTKEILLGPDREIYYLDGQSLIRIDPATGQQTLLFVSNEIRDFAVDSRGDALVLFVNQLIRIGPETVDVSDACEGIPDCLIGTPTRITVDENDGIFVSSQLPDPPFTAIRRIDPVAGEAETIAEGGWIYYFVMDMTFDDDGFLALTSHTQLPYIVSRVDPASGDQEFLAEFPIPVDGIAVDLDGSYLVQSSRDVYRVDPATGATTVAFARPFDVEDPQPGFGQLLVWPPRGDVRIDVRPASARNRLVEGSPQPFPVAVLGGAAVDVSDLEPETIAFGPAGAAPVGEAGTDLPPEMRFPDLDGDGFGDRVFFFDVAATGLSPGDTTACMEGVLLHPFVGCDDVEVVAPDCTGGPGAAIALIPLLALRCRRRGTASAPAGT